jgi:hypothetical protein
MPLAASGVNFDEPRVVFLIVLLGVIDGGMFAAAILAWRYGLERAHTIDDLLRPCANRDHVVSIVDTGIDTQRQAIFPVVFAILPWAIVLIHDGVHTWTEFPFLLLLLNTTWSAAVLGNVSYWLIVPPIMVMRLRSCDDVMLRWNDPARTPGIRTFSEGYGYPAFFLALGALGVTFPGLVDHPIFGAYAIYLYGWLILLSLWIGVLSQLNIYLIVRKFRLQMLDDLAPADSFLVRNHESASLLDRLEQGPHIQLSVSTYEKIASAPGLPFGTGLVVQYAAAVFGSIVAFMLQ